MVLWTFTAHEWVNNCAPWTHLFLFFFTKLFKLNDCPSGRIQLYLFVLVHLSCRIRFSDISVFNTYICLFLIHSVELCGSSLKDCHLHGNSGNSVLLNLFCWRHHMMWCNLLLNVLAIFMVEEFYIYAVVHFFFQSVMYKSNTKGAGLRLEYQRQCSIPCKNVWLVWNYLIQCWRSNTC